jgi:hypothetical protein
VEHRALDVVRFERIVADARGAERFDDVLGAARAALARALLGAEGRPVVARLVLAGVAGAQCTLSVPRALRHGALGAVTRGLAEWLWIDETWIDPIEGYDPA